MCTDVQDLVHSRTILLISSLKNIEQKTKTHTGEEGPVKCESELQMQFTQMQFTQMQYKTYLDKSVD